MSSHSKLIRMLEILTLLSGNLRYRIEEIAEKFHISQRSVYRYIDSFKAAGLVISNTNGYIQIDKNQSKYCELSDLLHFSEEEAWILSKAIHSIDDNTVIKSNLIKKLYSLYNFDRVANAIIKNELSDNVHNLIKAIRNKKQVTLCGYQSANSHEISDRLVEPYDFTTGYMNIWCYDIKSQKNKLFKIARIKKVEVEEDNWIYENEHDAGQLDIFRISSYKKIPVQLSLTMRAKNLLIEEYPLSEQFIEKENNGKYLFNGWVSSFEGVGRFILGMPNEIEVISPVGLKNYLNKIILNKRF